MAKHVTPTSRAPSPLFFLHVPPGKHNSFRAILMYAPPCSPPLREWPRLVAALGVGLVLAQYASNMARLADAAGKSAPQ